VNMYSVDYCSLCPFSHSSLVKFPFVISSKDIIDKKLTS